VTFPQLALSLSLGLLLAWAVVLVCRWQLRSSPAAAPKAGEILDHQSCKSLTDLAQHLIEVAKLAGSGRDIDLLAYAEDVLTTELGRSLAVARRTHLNHRFRLSTLLNPWERMSLVKGLWIADCPRCYRELKRGTLQIDDRADCFRCSACGAEGECFELILLTAPKLRKFMEIQDLSYRSTLLMFRFGLVVETAKSLVRKNDPGEGNCGKPVRLQPQGPWRPRGAAPAILEVAMRTIRKQSCSRPRKLELNAVVGQLASSEG
jgi:hypothetical protein